MLKRIALTALLVVLLLGNIPATNAVAVPDPGSGVIGAPVVVAEIATEEDWNNLKGTLPANVIWYLDRELNVTDRAGKILGTLDQAEAKLFDSALSVYYVRDRTAADALTSYLSIHEIEDCTVASDDYLLVKLIRQTCTNVRGLVDFRGRDSIGVVEVRDQTNIACAKTAILPDSLNNREDIRRLQKLLINVWTCESEDEGYYGAVVRGADGIIGTEYKRVYRALDAFEQNTYVRPVYVVGHRGLPYVYPENTLEGAKEAYARGADMVELDIQITKDKVLVLNHDETLDRTTDGKGTIVNMTWEQIKDFKVITSSGTNGVEYQACPIARVEDLFREFKGKDVTLLLEIKSYYPEIVGMLAELVNEYEISDQIIVISFHMSQLIAMRNLLPEISVGYLGANESNMAYELQKVNAIFSGNADDVTQTVLDYVRPRGIQLSPWTYNLESMRNKAFSSAFRCLTTDFPDFAEDYDVMLTAEDYSVEAGAEIAPKGWLLSRAGERTEVDCRALTISSELDSGGNGRAVVLPYTQVAYGTERVTLYAEPVTVTLGDGIPPKSDDGEKAGCSRCENGAAFPLTILALALSGIVRKR